MFRPSDNLAEMQATHASEDSTEPRRVGRDAQIGGQRDVEPGPAATLLMLQTMGFWSGCMWRTGIIEPLVRGIRAVLRLLAEKGAPDTDVIGIIQGALVTLMLHHLKSEPDIAAFLLELLAHRSTHKRSPESLRNTCAGRLSLTSASR